MSDRLPIDTHLPAITEKLRQGARTILTATPGAGKTTRLPQHLLQNLPGRIAVLQPRRLAAVAAASFVAQDLGSRVGEEVGYQVRGDSKIGTETRLIYMTDALFLRRFLSDPDLEAFDLIIIDEFHERNLNQDLVLGLIRELQDMGHPIKLMVMSATLELNALKSFLSPVEVIDIPGQVFPLAIDYQAEPMHFKTDYRFINRVTEAIGAASVDEGNILVFLPGLSEIRRVEAKLDKIAKTHEILQLHGSLSPRDQQRVLAPGAPARVILSTNVAEASVTVGGVRTVIDAGLARVNRMNFQSGFTRLDLSRISLFNAKQRAGRAAREASGRCLRLWTRHEDTAMEEQQPPACKREDLTQSLLLLAALKVTDFANFSWLTQPPQTSLSKARENLIRVGALTKDNRLTDHGQKILQFPAEPRWGSLLASTDDKGAFHALCGVVALLDERDLLPGHSVGKAMESDILPRLQVLHAKQDTRNTSAKRLARVRQHFHQLSGGASSVPTTFSMEAFNKALLITQTDRLCHRRGDSSRALMFNGRGVKLQEGTQVLDSSYFIALRGIDKVTDNETSIEWAHAVSLDEILKELGHQITHHEVVEYDAKRKKFFHKEFSRLGAIEIGAVKISPASAEQVAERLPQVILENWNIFVKQEPEVQYWWQRWMHYIVYNKDAELLMEGDRLFSALTQASYQKQTVDQVMNPKLTTYLEMTLPREILTDFQEKAPQHYKGPNQARYLIHYPKNERPFLEARIQELFGLTNHPEVLGEPVVMKLLSPAFRPVQITTDIQGFWKTSYLDVKKDLKGRYPKHSWPDDPLQARPARKGRLS